VSLTAPELAAQLDKLRAPILDSKRRDFPRLPAEDLEDAYSQAVEGILRNRLEFETEAKLAAYLHRAVANLARNVANSHAHRDSPLDDHLQGLGAEDDLDERVLGDQARAVLWEFLAEQRSEQDRTIAYLSLDPAHGLTARQIASELDLPYAEVRTSLKRSELRLSRLAANIARPGAFCHRRRGDVADWQQTGIVPLALRFHVGHCRNCRARYHHATVAAHRAFLPMIPPATAGALSRLCHTTATHPLALRAQDAVSRWRKVVPVGGGGAAVAAKLAATTAVLTAAAALHAVATANHRPDHPHRPAIHHAAVRAASADQQPSASRVASGAAKATAKARTVTSTTESAAGHQPPAPDGQSSGPAPTQETPLPAAAPARSADSLSPSAGAPAPDAGAGTSNQLPTNSGPPAP
jgi:RNA polymerase sigma factor (sigma-70 family)